jgi:hypothetical protein
VSNPYRAIATGDVDLLYHGQRIKAKAGDLIEITGDAARHAASEFAGPEQPRRAFRQVNDETWRRLKAVRDAALAEALARQQNAEAEARRQAELEAEAEREAATFEALVRAAVLGG